GRRLIACVVKSCVQPENGSPFEATVTAAPTQRPPGSSRGYLPRETPRGEDLLAVQIRFRRALTIAYAIWALFVLIDWGAVRYLAAGHLVRFLALRATVILVGIPVLWRVHRAPVPSSRMLTFIDLVTFTTPAAAIALMCVEFRGFFSPYAAGLCVVLLARAVIAHDPWRTGLFKTGAPVAT